MAVTLDVELSTGNLSNKARQTKDDLVGIADGYKRIGDASQAFIGITTAENDKLSKSTKKAGSELGKQVGIIEQLENHLSRLEKGQKKATNVKDVKKYNTEIVKTRAALDRMRTAGVGGFLGINTGANASIAIFSRLRGVLATTFAPLFAVGAAVQGLSSVVSLVRDFEQGSANLSAITGASGDALEFLKQSAVEVGTETTVSATQTLEAYKLIASAKPELLSNAEGLAQITREAVALTEAMGGELPDAATNLTDIMNQFQAPADQAGRFVNVLAAGSKEGSAEVDQIASSIVVAGSAMKSSNVQFEEGVGLVEALAERGIKGSEAGTALRNVLTKLAATDVLPKDATKRLEAAGVNIEQLSDKSLTFADRLRLLNPIQNDANALVSVFGLENLNAARNLIEQTDRIDELTSAVTGTNTAYEQAATRTRTLEGETARLRNTVQAFFQGNSGNLSQFLAFFVRLAREGVLVLQSAIDSVTPSLQSVSSAFSKLLAVIAPIFPSLNNANGEVSSFGKVIEVATVPIRVLFAFLENGIIVLTSVVNWFRNLSGENNRLQSFFNNISSRVSSFFDFLVNLPAIISAGLASIRVFVSETASGIGQLGRNIGSVLSEAFNIKKLITEGASDLFSAVDDLLVNPFAEVGEKASNAFVDTLKEKINQNKIKVKPDVKVEGLPGASDDPVENSESAFSKQAENQKKEEEKRAKEAEKREKEIAKLKLEAMRDGINKELALEEARFVDLIEKLDKYGLDSTEAVQQHELNKFAIRKKFAENLTDLDALTSEERINALYNQTVAEINALEAGLREANNGQLVDEQIKQINLLRENASREHLARLEEFYSDENKKSQEHEINLLELQRESFDSQAEFEEFKQREILNIRLKYAEAQLALLEQQKGAEDDAALSLRRTINEIKGELSGLTSENTAKSFSLFSLFGLDENDPNNKKIIDGINTAASAAVSVLGDLNKVRLDSANSAIEAADMEIEAIQSKIDAKQSELEEQQDLDKQGFANSASAVADEIQLLKDQQAAEQVERQKALEKKKKIQKEQAIIDTLTQSSSLISAAAQIFASVSAIPFVGPILGASLVGLMLGSFIAAKARVFKNISRQKAEKGMTGKVKGKRHYQGGEAFGDHIEVEDGEAFGILSRGATNKYGDAHAAFVNAANKGDRMGMFRVASMLSKGQKIDPRLADSITKKGEKAKSVKNEFSASLESKELKQNNILLKKMLKRNKRTTEYSGNVKIIRNGNSTRIIRKR